MRIATASPADDSNPTDELLIPAKEAARRLAICERKLWTLTNRRQIPAIRIGKSVRYPVDALKNWIRDSIQTRYRGGGSRI